MRCRNEWLQWCRKYMASYRRLSPILPRLNFVSTVLASPRLCFPVEHRQRIRNFVLEIALCLRMVCFWCGFRGVMMCRLVESVAFEVCAVVNMDFGL